MTTNTVCGPWWIGLDTWVLQDGNYTDVAVGERRQFALELGYSRAERLAPATVHHAGARYTGRNTTYDVTGRLLQAAESPRDGAFVLDVGVLAYTQWLVLDDLEPPTAGTWLTGAISLGVDPFFYVDELAGLPGMPPLIYTWRIDEVQLSTTPQIVVEPGHPLHTRPDERPQRVADLGREGWRTVEQTQAWDDDTVSYRLRCTLEDVPPTSTMGLSGPHSPYGPPP